MKIQHFFRQNSFEFKIYYNCITNNTSENTKIINANAIVINDDIDIIIVNVEFINEDEEIKNNT